MQRKYVVGKKKWVTHTAYSTYVLSKNIAAVGIDVVAIRIQWAMSGIYSADSIISIYFYKIFSNNQNRLSAAATPRFVISTKLLFFLSELHVAYSPRFWLCGSSTAITLEERTLRKMLSIVSSQIQLEIIILILYRKRSHLSTVHSNRPIWTRFQVKHRWPESNSTRFATNSKHTTLAFNDHVILLDANQFYYFSGFRVARQLEHGAMYLFELWPPDNYTDD